MHSTKDLRSSSFAIALAGRPGELGELLPRFSDSDRLGVVVRRPCGAVGASILILAAVTAFYDAMRRRGEEGVVYPDYFVFHAGAPLGDHGRLEIWPPHKEVVVADEPEALLRAINDRAVTRLLVEDGEPGTPVLAPETLASARRRIVTALAYAPGGRVRDADVELTGNAVTEDYATTVIERSHRLSAPARAEIAGSRAALVNGGRPVEAYRMLDLAEALALLVPRRTPA